MATSNDLNSAEKTYHAFTGALKWAVPVVATVILIIVIKISS